MSDEALEDDDGQRHLFDPDEPDREVTEHDLEHAGLVPEAMTAFVVYLDLEGTWRASNRMDLVHYMLARREAGLSDIVHGGASVASDSAHQQTIIDVTNNVVTNDARVLPNMVVQALEAQARAVQEKLANQRLMQNISDPGGKLITPR